MEQKIDRHDRILQLVRSRGPLLPAQLNKELNTNVLFASAMLGELVDRGVLKLSRAKIGSSPVYYVPGQEARLELLYKYLAKPEQTAYDLLKQNKILRDYDQQPVIRVALRAIKDFAFPLEVTLDNNTEIFWRWHLVSEKESEEMIKRLLNIQPEQPKPEVQEVQREALQAAPIAAETKILPE
ncbi:MAG: hypothetical protein KJ574_01950, partial [Nanoarchaeota archaeon]|nr:hypothetical protein [Nanoarchaeota archaeon]